MKTIKILFFILLLFLFYVSIKNIDIKLFIDNFDSDFTKGLLFAQIPIFASAIFFTIRHMFFINKSLSFSIAFNAMLLSVGLNYVLPARVSEFIKATYIKEKSNIEFSVGIGAVFLERFADLIVLSIITFSSLVFLAIDLQGSSFIFILPFIGLVALIIYLEKYILIIIEKVIPYNRVKNFLKNTYIHIRKQLFTKKFIIGLLYSFFIWFFSALTIFVFLNIAGEIQLNSTQVLLILIGGSIGLAIPALPGGLGTFEAIVVTILMKYGYDFNSSLALAIGLRINNMLLVLPYALIIAFKNGTGLKNLYQDLKKKVDKI
ncbi:lysylphosphatidylglycerol synthase transmembrane domain-containing protein [Aliarcobacter skirrowii]|uniref:lysylphosphatidylglycerol synthase transmembrane domain-containing protein n=1 Tax=Aliarcobacter skirrowii TaxID=28200 RepID=UPI0029A2822A|nr:lysylphosphatidylglycerol synthase transmembrane domain-containing protein [Aliarcobacter skirrowii]MDX4048461.1 lysylphosphatidylglycerol synthase transmembrane domain-containing protein [Aliarcobacter skirrowii]